MESVVAFHCPQATADVYVQALKKLNKDACSGAGKCMLSSSYSVLLIFIYLFITHARNTA